MNERAYVIAVAFDAEGRVLTVRKSRPAWQAGRLNFPGGKVEAGETTREAVAREFFEEVGAQVPEPLWEHFLTMREPGGWVVEGFRCLAVAVRPQPTAASESEPVVPLFPQSLAEACAAGETIANLAWILHLALDRDPRRGLATVEYLPAPEPCP